MNSNQLWRMLQGESIDGKYHLKEFLGAGGYGGVFLADEVVDDDFQRQVAVKLISPDKDRKKREEQRKELKNAVNLKHPNLLDCFVPGLCQIKGTEFFYLVMELAEETLEQRLQKGTLSATEVMEIVKAIASALAYLHNGSPPKVHRDVKPGNLLRVGNRWKLADLGLLTALGSQSSAFTSNRRASIKYAPPEAYQGKVATAWDIWSLGVMIVEMLTGELPFRGETEALLMNQVINEPPSIDWSKVPAPFVDIIQGCLEKDRAKRWTAQRVFEQVAKFPPKIISSILITNLAVSPRRDSSVYYDFFAACPACIARTRYDTNVAAWFCSICGAKIQIGNDAYFKCLNGHSCHISHARYACKDHPSEYEPTTAAPFASVIAISGKLTSVAGRRWLMELFENLGDDW